MRALQERTASVAGSLEGRRPHVPQPYWLAPQSSGSTLAAIVSRTFDLVLASLLLIVLAPLMLLVAILIKLDSPGPVLFRQRRLGRQMRPFSMLKFRTMKSGVSAQLHQDYIAELAAGKAGNSSAALKKLQDDPRVTSLGRLLRKLSVDETTQLLNVLAGHMSLVGPRPALEYELEFYSPVHFARFAVRPGLTGLWQVSGRSTLGFYEMLDLDVEYARRATLLADLHILVRTPRAVIGPTA
jgi:lipopolysaccharide/colanic/teichoic acid biosynthesis glycosyltransferase